MEMIVIKEKMDGIIKGLKHWPALLFGVVVAVIFLLVIFTYQLRSSEVAVVKTLGRISVQEEAGLHFCWPYPVEQIYKFDRRIRCFDGLAGKLEETSTSDGQMIVTQIYVVYRIIDVEKFYTAAGDEFICESLLNDITRSARNSVIGRYSIADLINTDTGKSKLCLIEKEICDSLRKASGVLGLKIDSVGIKKLILPEKTTEKVFARMKAERNVLSEEYRAEGKAEATRIKTEADNAKRTRITLAESEAKGIKGEGDVLAAKFMAGFSEDPGLAVFLRKLESIGKMNSGRLTLILNTDNNPLGVIKDAGKNISDGENK